MNDSTYRVLDLVTKTAAVAVGALWTYVNYLRNRTHHLRCEAQVKGSCELVQGRMLIYVASSLKNVGLSKFQLVKKECGIVVERRWLKPGPGPLGLEAIGAADVFETHSWLEPGEQIYDETVLSIPLEPEDVALSVEIRITGVSRGRLLERWKKHLSGTKPGRLLFALLLMLSLIDALAFHHITTAWCTVGFVVPMMYVCLMLILIRFGVERHAEWSSRCVVKLLDPSQFLQLKGTS